MPVRIVVIIVVTVCVCVRCTFVSNSAVRARRLADMPSWPWLDSSRPADCSRDRLSELSSRLRSRDLLLLLGLESVVRWLRLSPSRVSVSRLD